MVIKGEDAYGLPRVRKGDRRERKVLRSLRGKRRKRGADGEVLQCLREPAASGIRFLPEMRRTAAQGLVLRFIVLLS